MERNQLASTPRLLNFRVFPVVGNLDDHNANVMVIGMMEDVLFVFCHIALVILRIIVDLLGHT